MPAIVRSMGLKKPDSGKKKSPKTQMPAPGARPPPWLAFYYTNIVPKFEPNRFGRTLKKPDSGKKKTENPRADPHHG